MKKFFLAGSLVLLVFSCSKKETPVESSPSPGTSDARNTSAGHLSGEQMIETLDCSGCHSITEKMVGPSYREIAAKYTDKDTELLASKIIEGGSGVWGNVPMPAHPQISKEDAGKIVQYIVSLKK
ncbi:c-type cytochrome [uncultured Chryseobacterium sp.]|uniref:c-type cytochrome n=1 Tax=uncultured Chryseobacterium sp. TaxID=259322 RepID=UPI0025FA0972|nr:c-type cytochrome [uncultured Chryseobacterium sp.]